MNAVNAVSNRSLKGSFVNGKGSLPELQNINSIV